MCGRFNLRTTPRQIAEFFGIESCPDFKARYNIAPTQDVLVAKLNDHGEQQVSPMHWGLIPSWAKETKIAHKLINARSETVAEKPSFRSAFKRRRCLIPVSGFYEWQREGKQKFPFHIHQENDQLFALAGLWETWHHEELTIHSCTILTTEANSLMAPLHDRMPVVVQPGDFSLWLNHDVDAASLTPLFDCYEWHDFITTPVRQTVNNVRNESADCIKPLKSPPPGLFELD